MPRKPRFFLPGIPVHVVQRGNNRQAVFFADDDCRAYLGWLEEACQRYGCEVHAYVLMTNHVHLLMTPCERDSVSRAMQYVGRRYVPYVNSCYRRSGTLWEGRFKACLIDGPDYLLICHRYIELNPVRAGMVALPDQYPWSSYRRNALAEEDTLVQPHSLYLGLDQEESKRAAAYRELFRGHLDGQVVNDIRAFLQTGTPMGNDRFREQIERALQIRVGQPCRGRPKGITGTR